MALPAFVKSLDSIENDAHKELYREYNDKDTGRKGFVLDVEECDGFALDNVVGLRTVLSEVKEERANLKKKVQAFGEVTPDEVKKWRSRAQEMEDWDPEQEVKEKIETRVKDLRDKFEADTSELKEALSATDKEYTETLIDRALLDGLSRHKLVEGGADLLRPHIRDQLIVKKDSDGKRDVFVRDPNSNDATRITMEQGKTGDMGVEELITLMSKDKRYAPCFEGSGSQGSVGGERRTTKEDGDVTPDNKPKDPDHELGVWMSAQT